MERNRRRCLVVLRDGNMLERHLQFNGLRASGWLPIVLIAMAVAVVLMAVLMRAERRLISRRVSGLLLGLRLAVMGVLLLVFLEPVVSWTFNREQAGRIVVAVDLSRSMKTADVHASKGEKLRWARALGMIGNPDIDARLDRWQKSFQQGLEPVWVDPNETGDPDRRRELAAARKANLESLFAEIDRLSRKEIVRRLLMETASPLLPRLQKLANIDLVVFGGEMEATDPSHLEGLFANPPQTLLPQVTDISQMLSGASETTDGSKLLGVVLMTDGRDNAGRDVVGAAGRLGQLSVPVYPVLFGSTLRPKDLAIASLDYPNTVFKGDKTVLTAVLNTSGFEGKELTVVLERNEEKPVKKTVRADDNVARVRFNLNAEQVGHFRYTLRTDVQPGETRKDNNSRSFAMSVVDDAVHALLIDGESRWEFRFLNNALERDDRVKSERIVFHQPYLGLLPKPFFPQTLSLPQQADDLAHSPFAEQDLVIIGDVAPADLPPRAWQLLEKFVGESGGTLVFIAGTRYLPLAYHSPLLDRLLPVTDLRPINLSGPSQESAPSERGFRLKLTPEGEAEPMFQFDTDRVANRKIWAELPGQMWGLLGRAKRAATVYATTIPPGQATGLETERRTAVIVAQQYGLGQVLWMGINGTWRWRSRVGDKYHHRFWGQLARWASENKATAGNEFVKFGPDRTDVEVGDQVTLRARWTARFLRRFPDLKAKAEVFRIGAGSEEKPFSTLDLKPLSRRPLIHEGRLTSLPTGDYRVKLVVTGADLGPDEISTPLYVRGKQTLELSDLSANRDLLAQLADASGGTLLYPDETDKLLDLFDTSGERTTVRRETTLWDHWPLLVLFFALLTTEWVIRKLNGLP